MAIELMMDNRIDGGDRVDDKNDGGDRVNVFMFFFHPFPFPFFPVKGHQFIFIQF